ncbi:hypothetical protein AaE_002114 [Aphanomyces astaci]|uniref:Uncharacterized protein n=1 Tax=Aphanomyces astaci TaxID=112090 RepID=A0A6A5AAS2_APHAT|nr:hypothetical protein AaE_002114 [Aphanomyces astaci]
MASPKSASSAASAQGPPPTNLTASPLLSTPTFTPVAVTTTLASTTPGLPKTATTTSAPVTAQLTHSLADGSSITLPSTTITSPKPASTTARPSTSASTTTAAPSSTPISPPTARTPTPSIITSARSSPPSVVKVACMTDTYECRSGLLVARDPSNDCKFYPCRDADNETSPPLSTAPNTTAAVDTTSFPSNITHRKFHDFTPSSALNWTVADSTIPAEVSAAALRSFLAYNDSSVCDHLAVGITSAERADLPSSRALFHVVMDVSCTLNTTNQTSGVYVLELLTESGPPSVSLTQCGVLANGTLSNWLTQHNHSTACQTPRERLEYIHQPLEHTLHLPKEGSTAHSSHGMFSDLAALMEKPTVLYLFVASVAGIVLLAFGFAVVVGRRRIAAMKRRQMERSILEEVATGRIEERAREAEARRRQQEEEVEDEKTPTETDALDYIGKAHRDKNERRDGDHPSIFTIE